MTPRDPAESSGGSERAFFRVPTWIEVRCKPVGRMDAERLEAEILGRAPLDLSEMDAGLALWLERIEDKLDRLLMHLQPEEHASIAPEGLQEVSLSGSGMRFAVKDTVSPDATLALEFVLPGSPGRRVRCLADVAATAEQRGEEPGSIAVAFSVIHEADRDAIVRHALEVQRSQIRARSGGDDGE